MNPMYGNSDPQYAARGGWGQVAAAADEWERTTFIRRTYTHLAAAVAAFALIDAAIFTLVPQNTLARMMATMVSGYNWLLVLGAFMVVSWIADRWANTATSLGKQYAGLGLYVLAEAVIFVPLLYVAQLRGAALNQNIIGSAALVTAVIFGGLTAMVFFTRADFSWLGRYLWLAGLAGLAYIVCGMVFGFGLGNVFVALIIGLAAGYILYSTSNVLHHYRTDQYVAAALALFASVALLFYYILLLFMRRD